MIKFWRRYQSYIELLFVALLAGSVRLTSLNVFRAVDEEDRWDWAVDFFRALLAGDLPATLVGDGYPGIFPVWLETIWLFLASLYRSALQGRWLGDDGVYLLIHQWSRTDTNLYLQRFPVVLANTVLVLLIFLYLRKLFERRVALLGAILISLDPFYLSDSRVNRAEALLTGLMMLSLLALIAAQRWPRQWRHLLFSAILGGLAMLTKSQALVLLPLLGAIVLLWQLRDQPIWWAALGRAFRLMGLWTVGAAATFILLWPATWTVPGPTFRLMANYAIGKVGEEGVKIFFLGQTVLDEDPGLIFYPVIFILRATPLMVIGLLAGLGLLLRRARGRGRALTDWRGWLDQSGLWALLAYVLLYVAGMSLGSHKQDRFLMAAFPALNILAAVGLVRLVTQWRWPDRRVWLAGGLLLLIQLATALPFHPYYFSYFNPLVGGGPVAARLTRIGWGEGMDQVADYLQRQENPESLVVASRFFLYLLDFKGTRLNLSSNGEWVRADKIIFYIQQAQRMLDPSPGVIRYFQQHVPPEKVITIDWIDYAWIYPNPIQYPADPLVDRLEGEMSLFGYRWQPETDGTATVRLIWENLSPEPRPVGLRLWSNQATHSRWLTCTTRPEFEAAARQPGEVVESDCPLPPVDLPPGLYDLQVGVQLSGSGWQPLDFAAGWSAVELTPAGRLDRVEPTVAFARLAEAGVPQSATLLERTYADRVRLLAYELSPSPIRPGQPLNLTLYWQAVRILERDAHVSVQAFIGQNERVALANGTPLGGHSTRPTSSWRPGEVIRDMWTLDLPAELPAPAQLRLDVGLFLPETLVTLPVRNQAGQDIPGAIGQFRLEPERWPTYRGDHPLAISFDEALLLGYESELSEAEAALAVTLYWQAVAAPEERYTAFVHLLNSEGELVAQSDVAPAAGLFPTEIWQPGDVVLSWHRLALPPELPPGNYRLLAGLYRAADGQRLPGQSANGQPLANDAALLGEMRLP